MQTRTESAAGIAIADHYRCPEVFLAPLVAASLSPGGGPMRIGGSPFGSNGNYWPEDGRLVPPFDPTDAIDSLRRELYAAPMASGSGPNSLLTKLYYSVRPLFPVAFRKHLQRIYLHGWDKIAFPRWPLDVTVERLLEASLLALMQSTGVDEIPFIWFWPDGADSAALITHDVETTSGRDFCGTLMDIDESFGIRSAFQVVPEDRYTVTPSFLEEIRSRGHEINIQDLNHDGRLFSDRTEFDIRVKRINQYGREFRARGFRSAVLYRNLNWFGQLEFEYDMSVPNAGHLEPQRGGCCTVFPYFIGDLLELPVTTTQDYSLFHILRDFRLDLWKTQAAGVTARNGLLTFIVHPDYLLDSKARNTYHGLLEFLCRCRSDRGMWIAPANEVNTWWRQRSRMNLVKRHGEWRIEGIGCERAQIAYARIRGGQLSYFHDGGPRISLESTPPFRPSS